MMIKNTEILHISMFDLLQRLGIRNPVWVDDNTFRYVSPFDGGAALDVCNYGQFWMERTQTYDGCPVRGVNIDFVRKYYRLRDNADAVEKLCDLFPEIDSAACRNEDVEIVSIRPSFISQRHLCELGCLAGSGITDRWLLIENSSLALIDIGGIPECVLGYPNMYGGFVAFNPKRVLHDIGPTGFTWIRYDGRYVNCIDKRGQVCGSSCFVFGNYLDYLSYVTIGKSRHVALSIRDYIVMNNNAISPALFSALVRFETVYCWLPSDERSVSVTKRLCQLLSGDRRNFTDISQRFPECTSINDYLKRIRP